MIESAEEFVRLRNSEIQEEYTRAAHDEAPIEVWNALLENYPDMAFWVAQNKTVPYELLEVLSHHEEERVRSMVAMKNKLKEPLLLELASDTSDSVRMSVARHKNATLTVLKKLKSDSWGEIASVVSDRIERGNYKLTKTF